MNISEKNKVYEEKINSMIFDFFNSTDEDYQLKKNEIGFYYGYLINSNILSIDDKKEISHIYTNSFYYYFLDFILIFLSSSIINVYKKDVDEKLLINNDYFFNRFLGNKEKIKKIFLSYQDLGEINYNVSIKFLKQFDFKTMQIELKKYQILIAEHHRKMVDFFNVSDDISLYIFNLKKIIEEDYLINFTQQKDVSFFEMNEKNEIIFSNFFILFFSAFFNFKIENKPLDLKKNNEFEIKNELSKKIKTFYEN